MGSNKLFCQRILTVLDSILVYNKVEIWLHLPKNSPYRVSQPWAQLLQKLFDASFLSFQGVSGMETEIYPFSLQHLEVLVRVLQLRPVYL